MTGGKVLVFAHHRNVLDALEQSVVRTGRVEYIRIDGRTKVRTSLNMWLPMLSRSWWPHSLLFKGFKERKRAIVKFIGTTPPVTIRAFRMRIMPAVVHITAEGQARPGGHFPEQSQRAGGSSGAHGSWHWHHPHSRQQVCTDGGHHTCKSSSLATQRGSRAAHPSQVPMFFLPWSDNVLLRSHQQ